MSDERRLFDEAKLADEESLDLRAAEAELDLRERTLDSALASNERAKQVSEETLRLEFKV